MPVAPDFDLYACAISSFVGSLGGTWPDTIVALIAASNISAGTESFTISSDVEFGSQVTLRPVVNTIGFVSVSTGRCSLKTAEGLCSRVRTPGSADKW